MKYLSIGLLCLLVLLTNCQSDLVNPTINECVGSSDYYIRNESEYPLSVTTPQLGTKTEPSQTIASRQTGKITQDAIFGYIPKPTDTFTSLLVYRQVDGKKVLIYRQDPVTNEAWVKQKQNARDPDFGCYSVSYTLTITN